MDIKHTVKVRYELHRHAEEQRYSAKIWTHEKPQNAKTVTSTQNKAHMLYKKLLISEYTKNKTVANTKLTFAKTGHTQNQ